MEKPRQGIINEIRKVIDPLWKAADLVGRSWGVKKDGKNPLFGSHILLGDSHHLVVVVEHRATKEVSVIEYELSKSDTPLGNKIRDSIAEAGFSLFEEGRLNEKI